MGKILPLPFRGDGIRQLIGPALGLGQHVLGDIRGQDTGVPILGLGAEKLLDIDGDIVRLLSAGAAGAPNGQYLVALVPADQVGQDGLLEELEVVGFPHEERVVGGQLVQHQLHILGVPVLEQLIHEGAEIRIAAGLHGGGQAAGDQLLLLGQVDPIVALNELIKPLEIFI